MFTASFAKALAERVVTAFAVSLISVLFVGGELLDIRQVQWGQALGIAGGAALLSLLKGLVAGKWLGPPGSPSLVRDPAAAGSPDLGAAAERLTFPAPTTTRTNGGTGTNVTKVPKLGGYEGGGLPPPPLSEFRNDSGTPEWVLRPPNTT